MTCRNLHSNLYMQIYNMKNHVIRKMLQKKFFLLAFTLLTSGLSVAQTLPTLSTDGNETWYYLQFKRGSAVIQDMGDSAVLKTAIQRHDLSVEL